MSVAGKKQIASFTLVGIIGFLVDAGTLQFALSVLHLEPVRARLVSFPVAVIVTWMLHRQFTFAHRRSDKRSTELARYLGAQTISWAAGFVLYVALVLNIEFFQRLPLAALIGQSLVGAFCNYLLSHYLVFAKAMPMADGAYGFLPEAELMESEQVLEQDPLDTAEH